MLLLSISYGRQRYDKKIKGQNVLSFYFFVVPLHPQFKGCRLLAAEMIPSKPDPGNAGVGMDSSFITVFPFTLFIN
jgi:hypothetical protein